MLSFLKRLVRNLYYLCRHDLSADLNGEIPYRVYRHYDELVKAKMFFVQDDSLRIADDESSWKKILAAPGSIVRIGDGELAIIAGKSIEFQRYDKRLADYLVKILSEDRTDLYIGIDYNYFHGYDNVTEYIRRHNFLYGMQYKKTLVQYCNPEREYISSSFNQLYIDYETYDWERYLQNIESLFAGRELVVFSGKGIFDSLQYNVFNFARSCEYVNAPAQNAFDEFDLLLQKATSFSKDKTLCFVLGPTAKPLVYELSKQGYTAWDLGHMAKDYDCCRRKTVKDKELVIRFFAPD